MRYSDAQLLRPLPLRAGVRETVTPAHLLPNLDGQILALSPQGFYKFDEASGNVLDYSGNSRALDQTNGSPSYQNVKGIMRRSVINFGGATGKYRNTELSTALDNISMECWINPQVISASNLYVLYNGNPASNGWGMSFNTSYQITVLRGGVAFDSYTSTAMTQNCWNHVILTRESGTWKAYINGALAAGTIGSSAPITPSGAFGWNAASHANIQAALNYVALYDVALTLGHAQTRYNAVARAPMFGNVLNAPIALSTRAPIA